MVHLCHEPLLNEVPHHSRGSQIALVVEIKQWVVLQEIPAPQCFQGVKLLWHY